jgi:hypothetical protein
VTDGLVTRGFIKGAELLDRQWGWHRLPKVLAMPTMLGLRMALRRQNLFDTSGTGAAWGPEAPVPGRTQTRSVDGTATDPRSRDMGRAGSRFARNVPLEHTYRKEVFEPNPRTVSTELLARRQFIPATAINLLTAAWIQFEVHDWMQHGRPDDSPPWEVVVTDDDPWPTPRMEIPRTAKDPDDGDPPTYRNTESHWWDASQVYGSSPERAELLRANNGKGHLQLIDGKMPFDPPNAPSGSAGDLVGAGNWWVGLAMFHTIFMREHNAICDRLAASHPTWTDDKLYDQARLINAALIAKIHTLEWTPALFAHPETKLAMKVNWWGFQGERLTRRFGRLTKSEILSGIPGSELYYHGAPYAITEEFVAVYRMHPLIPDEFRLRSAADGALVDVLPFDQVAGTKTHELLDRIEMDDLFYSFGTSNPGAVVLHNYPNHMRAFTRPGRDPIDVATIDILRDRERGVPRYNEFRRLFRLAPATRFEDFSDAPAVVADLRRIYSNPDDVDLMVGMYAEQPPEGFAISDTAFRVFILMASRRLKSDRFFTYDFTPDVYTQEGLDWIDDNSMASVVRRHYPSLERALHGVDNAFLPWNRATDVDTSAAADDHTTPEGWRLRRGVWNLMVRFKFRMAKPLVVPIPSDQPPLTAVPFAQGFPDIPIAGLVVADHVPADENEPLVMLFVRFQSWLNRVFPPRVPGLPPIDADPRKALAVAYPPRRRAYRSPSRPPEYDDLDLGGVAVASPYACYVNANGGGTFEWDLTGLDRFECHAGLRAPAARVEFELDEPARRLRAVTIDSELGVAHPGDRDWHAAQHLAMCALATHVTLVRHFNWIHLVCGGPLALVTHDSLPPAHPIRRLLQPHVHATQFSNRIVTPPQMERGGDFESVFSFTHRGMCDLFEATIGEFDLQIMEPGVDAARRGIVGLALDQPALDNRNALMHVIRAHAERYLALYYDDAAIASDEAFARWLHDLRAFVPHGVDELIGSPVTVHGAAALLATLISMGSVDHEIVDSGVWDYQLWSDVQPVRVYRNGQRMPLDVYQRLVNANFILNVDRTRLMSDFSYLAVDQPGADAFLRFRRDLVELQDTMDRTPAACWRIEPRQLKANINY